MNARNYFKQDRNAHNDSTCAQHKSIDMRFPRSLWTFVDKYLFSLGNIETHLTEVDRQINFVEFHSTRQRRRLPPLLRAVDGVFHRMRVGRTVVALLSDKKTFMRKKISSKW